MNSNKGQELGEMAIENNVPRRKRQSIQPTYDSRVSGPPYYVWTFLNGKRVGKQDLQDPFVNTRVSVSWLDLFRGLFRRNFIVEVQVHAHDHQRTEDVMELDANYLSYNSTRRDDWNKELNQSLQDHVTREMGEA